MKYSERDTEKIFGIPVTKGKLLSKTDIGFVVSFNFEHLLLKRLLTGQIFSSNKQPLTPLYRPTALPNIFQYPLLPNSPDFAFSQREFTIISFIKTSRFKYSSDLRLIFWYQRSVIPAINDNDFLDVPDEYVPLVINVTKKNILLSQGKPIPNELEQDITRMTKQLKEMGNSQNYYILDTFNLSIDDVKKLSLDNMQNLETKGKNKKDKEIIREYLYKEEINTLKKLNEIAELNKLSQLARKIVDYFNNEYSRKRKVKNVQTILSKINNNNRDYNDIYDSTGKLIYNSKKV